MRLSLAVAAVAALGLAACGDKPATDGAATTSEPAASTASTPAAPAAASPTTMEGPAAGKWRVTMSTGGMTMPPRETCYTKQMSLAEAEKMQQEAGVTCSEQTYRREGDAYVGHSVCTMEIAGKTTTTTTDTRVTGDFNTRYTMDMTNVMNPPPVAGMGEQKMTMVSERIGDC